MDDQNMNMFWETHNFVSEGAIMPLSYWFTFNKEHSVEQANYLEGER